MRPRLLTLSIVALFALPALAGVPRPEDQECRSCSGRGEALQPCVYCDGDGKAPCEECLQAWSMHVERMRKAIVPPARESEAKEGSGAVFGSMEDLLEAMNGRSRRPSTNIPGKIFCYGCWAPPTVYRRPNPNACKICDDAETTDCAPCKGKGERPCRACKRGERVAPCIECQGSGRAAPSGLSSECPWCAGRRLRKCALCSNEELLRTTCSSCLGHGKIACGTCRGTRDAPCRPCEATGRVRDFYGDLGTCGTCKRKGLVRCGDCEKGWTSCEPCLGTGEAAEGCPQCFGTKKAPCMGCWDGSGTAWVVTGKRLFESGRAERAAALLDTGLEREQRSVDQRIRWYVGSDSKRRAYARSLDRELRALERLLEKARAESAGGDRRESPAQRSIPR